MSNIAWQAIDLFSLGLITRGVSGVHDLIPPVTTRQFVAGSALPYDHRLREHDIGQMTFDCAVGGDDHADLVAKLRAIRRAASPRKDWGFFTIVDLPGLRCLALPEKLPVSISSIPYWQYVTEFNWSWQRLWWEDAEAISVNDPLSIDNTGDLPCWPTYTCTVTGSLPSGLWFEVGGRRFTYTGALSPGAVLVVRAEAMTCLLNGAHDMARVALGTAWPELLVGSNAINKSSANYTLSVAYRRRYE
jgi:hypothetical protein